MEMQVEKCHSSSDTSSGPGFPPEQKTTSSQWLTKPSTNRGPPLSDLNPTPLPTLILPNCIVLLAASTSGPLHGLLHLPGKLSCYLSTWLPSHFLKVLSPLSKASFETSNFKLHDCSPTLLILILYCFLLTTYIKGYIIYFLYLLFILTPLSPVISTKAEFWW